MILKRYISREVLSTSLVVMLFLMMMTLGNWLIISFGMVVKGRIQYDMIAELMIYQIPQLLEFIIPLGVFIGIMLSLSRQYVEQEVTIIKSSGLSPRQYAQLLIPLLAVFFIIQCGVIWYAKPAGLYATEKMKSERAIKHAFDLVKPKEFITINQYNLYVGGFSADKLSLTDLVFIEKGGATNGRDRVILAKTAKQVHQPDNQANSVTEDSLKHNEIEASKEKVTQLDLYQGRQYEVGADNKSYNQVSFEKYRISIKVPQKHSPKDMPLEAQPSLSLLDRISDKDALAEVVYRLTVPFIIWLAVILALPLSYVRPRKGRWVRLVPAILLFATSVLVMNAVKGSVIKGKISALVLPMIVLVYALFGVYLYQKNQIHKRLKDIVSGQKHATTQGGH